MDTGIDYPWIGKMFICIIHGTVHIFMDNVALSMNSVAISMNSVKYSPWIVKNEFTLSMDSLKHNA